MSMNVNYGGFDRALVQMLRGNGLRRGLRAAALYLRGKFATYPPVSRRPVAQFWGDKQRRGFFAALNAGDIEVPYRRGTSPNSERLAARWAVTGSVGGLRQTIGNSASYVNLVQGDDQSVYHRITGWKTVEDIVRDERAEVGRIVDREVARDLNT